MDKSKSYKKRHVVFHLIHKEKTGGVELAIRRSIFELNKVFEYRVYSVMSFKKGQYSHSIFQLIYDIFKYKKKIIISSLWLSHILALMFSYFVDSWVAFFHSASVFHFLDRVGKSLSIKFANTFFCDSEATAKFHNLDKYFLIPYVFESKNLIKSNRDIDFLFVARADPVKRFDRFVDLISILRNKLHHLEVQIYSDKCFCSLLNESQRVSLSNFKVFINASQEKISDAMRNSKFFVSTSEKEGFGTAIAEGINAGCVPILTKVGEPAIYLDDDAAIFLNSFENFSLAEIEKIKITINDKKSLKNINKKAIKKLSAYGNYTNAFIKSVKHHLIDKT